MTSRDLLDELSKQRDSLNTAIDLIEHLLRNEETPKSALLKSIRKYRKNNRKPLAKQVKKPTGRKWTPQQRTKFLATMKEKYGKAK